MSILSFFNNPQPTSGTSEKTELYVDVREPSERSQGHLQGSINIPLGDIQQGKHNLPQDKRIGVYCRSGARSSVAMQVLKAQGYNVYNAGGIIYGIENIPIIQ
ncbi:hypothetical protein XF24_00488 [candidate division SR1 bacterium Aalborg_AAW-1]|nr:hypothetical protein XF24_00488 [candidate division SR1 bacterium Aalborg_AAW-1]